MKIWVVGSDGLLGKALPADIRSSKSDADITRIDDLRSFSKKNRGITHIINASAYSLVDRAESNQELAFQVNANGPENLGIIANEIGAKVVHISTDYVFPGNIFRPLHEEDIVGPINYYGETKLIGEKKLINVAPSSCVIRTSAIFGMGGKSFITKLLELFQEKKEIFLANDQLNSPTFVEDLSKAVFQMLNQVGLFHFSNSGVASKFDFGVEIFHYARNNNIPIKTKHLHSVPSSFFPSLCKRPIYTVFDTTKIQKHISIRDWKSALHCFLRGVL